MEAIAMLAIFVIGLLIFGAAAVAFGADSRDEMIDDQGRVQPSI